MVRYRCIYHSTPGGYGGWGGMAGVLEDLPAITVTSPLRAWPFTTSDPYRVFVGAGVPGVVPVAFAGTATDNGSVASVEIQIGGPLCCVGSPVTTYAAECEGCGTKSAMWHADVDLNPGAYTWRVWAFDGPAGGLGTTGSAWYSLIVA